MVVVSLRATTFTSRSEMTTIVGPWDAAGDSGGDIEGKEAFAESGVADEQGDAAERDASGPEPADALRLDARKSDGAGDIGGVT